MEQDGERCDLVLGGGGVRGEAHIGALTALEEADYRVVRAAGASAGAIAGAFAVAGVPASTLRELFDSLDLTQFVFADVVGRLRSRRGVGRLIERWSDDATEPVAWLSEVLGAQGIETFGDLKVDDPDPAEPPERRYRLVVRCLDILQRRVVRLPWDYARYGLDPDRQSVAEAVRASMSIPFVYEPVRIGGTPDTTDPGTAIHIAGEAGGIGDEAGGIGDEAGGIGDEAGGHTGLLIDGGLTSGFPVTVLDRQDGATPRWPTFGIRLLPRAPADGAVPENGIGLARMVFDALLDSSDLLEPMNDCDERRTVRVDLSETSAIDLGDRDDDRDMFADGHAAMRGFLETWDFEAYLRDCGR